MSVKTHKLIIQGRTYSVRSDASDEYMVEVAKLVDARMNEARAAGAGPQQTAVMAAMNLAGELLDRRERFGDWKKAVHEQLSDIGSMVDRALDEAASSPRS